MLRNSAAAALLAVIAGALVVHLLLQMDGSGMRGCGHQRPEASEASATQPPATAAILFVGDIMLGRHVETLSERNGADYPFRNVENLLASVGYTVANLEGPIVEGAPKTSIDGFQFAFPTNTPRLLADRGVRVVSLANNHGVDQGQAGHEETVRRLGEAGISSVGHPLHIPEGSAEALSSVVVPPPEGSKTVPLHVYVAFNATFPSFSLEKARMFVLQTRRDYPDAFITVLIHWGTEYELVSTPRQREIAHALADAGAELIIGHHPHVVEEIEAYGKTAIFYSLGNFIFDQYFSDAVEQGLAVRMRLGKDAVEYDLLPVNGDRKSRPRVMESGERDAFLEQLGARSGSLKEEVSAGRFEVRR